MKENNINKMYDLKEVVNSTSEWELLESNVDLKDKGTLNTLLKCKYNIVGDMVFNNVDINYIKDLARNESFFESYSEEELENEILEILYSVHKDGIKLYFSNEELVDSFYVIPYFNFVYDRKKDEFENEYLDSLNNNIKILKNLVRVEN